MNHVRITWEKYKNNKLVLQCLNCQKFGHSINNCFKNPKYVKCLGSHRAMECDKEDAAPPQCVNCEGLHPANFAGCPKFKYAIYKKSKKKPSSKLTHVPKITNHPGQNDNSYEINNDYFPSLNKSNAKVYNPTSNNLILTYSQITKQILKPSQTSINNISLFNELLNEVDKVISCHNIPELLRNVKRLNANMQQATDTNDQLLAVINFMTTNTDHGG